MSFNATREEIQSIELQRVTAGYEGDPVLIEIDYKIPLSQVVWVQGAGGAGKSTFVKLFAGLVKPQMGELMFNGKKMSDMSFEEFLPLRLNIGYSFDFGGLLSNRTIMENLLLPLQYHREVSNAEAKERVNKLLDRFGVGAMKMKRPASVIGGMKKLTCVMRAFVMNPQLLLLDDPTTGLSPAAKSELSLLIQDYQKQNPGATILVTTADENFIKPLADQSIELVGGRISGTEKIRGAA